MNHVAAVAAFLLLATMPHSVRAEADLYSDALEAHYPARGQQVDLADDELEEPIVVRDERGRRSATVRRTRGDRYGYEKQRGLVTFEGAGLDEPRYVSATGFRTLDVSWITAKLVLIDIGVGHAAAVEAIYDVENDAWVYRESVQHMKSRLEAAPEPEERRDARLLEKVQPLYPEVGAERNRDGAFFGGIEEVARVRIEDGRERLVVWVQVTVPGARSRSGLGRASGLRRCG